MSAMPAHTVKSSSSVLHQLHQRIRQARSGCAISRYSAGHTRDSCHHLPLLHVAAEELQLQTGELGEEEGKEPAGGWQ